MRFSESNGESTLDKPQNLQRRQAEEQEEADPMFKKTTRLFDELQGSSLLTSKLGVTHHLLLKLNDSVIAADQQNFSDPMPVPYLDKMIEEFEGSKICEQLDQCM